MTRSTTRFEGRSIDTTSKLGLCIPNRVLFYRKWNQQNATQKPAQSNTPIAWGPMWFTKQRVNFVGNAMLDLLGVPSTTERSNASLPPKIKPRPQPWVFIIRMHPLTWSPPPNYASSIQDCLRHGERWATVRLRIEKALPNCSRKPALNRRGEETGQNWLSHLNLFTCNGKPFTCSRALL